MESQILSECAGNMLFTTSAATINQLVQNLKKICNQGVFNYIGLKEHGLMALLHMSQTACIMKGGKSYQYVEIVRIHVDQHMQGLGMFRNFIKRMQEACCIIKRALVIGCVESLRLLQILQTHTSMWQRLASDPTSFICIPSIKHAQAQRSVGDFECHHPS